MSAHPAPAAAALCLTLILLAPPPSRADDALLTQREAARAANDSATERELTLRLLEQNPADPTLLGDLARLWLEAGELDRCADTLVQRRAALGGEADAALLEAEGDLAARRGEPGVAKARWRAALALEPDRVTALAKLAARLGRERDRAAETPLRERLLDLRDEPADHIALAKVAAERRDFAAVVERGQHLRDHHANHRDAKAWAAAQDRLMAEVDQLHKLDALVAAKPDQTGPALERAWLLSEVGLPEQALDDGRRALALRPGSKAIRYQLAGLLNAAGQGDEAARLGFEPRYFLDRKRIGALAACEEAAEAGSAEALAKRSGIWRGLGQRALALVDARAAVAADPELPMAQVALARLEADLGHLTAAKAAYAAALESDPDHATALSGAHLLHAQTGDYAEATALAERLLAIHPTDSLRQTLARYRGAVLDGDPN